LHEVPVNARQETIGPAPGTAGAKQTALARVGRALEKDGTVVVVVAAFAATLITHLRTALAADGWMALLSGRVVAQHGLPSHDTLTAWTAGRRWTDQQWLAQLSFYGLWRLGGIKLALLAHALLVTSGIGIAALVGRMRGATARSVVWVAIPVLIAYYQVASVMRPQSFAFPLFSATLWLLLADARRPSRRVFFVLPLLVLWANLHGSVILGAGLVALAGLVPMLQQRRPSARGVTLLLAPWACILASPYALHLPAYYEKILVGGNFKEFVTEWAPTTLTAKTAAVYLIVLGGLWLLGRAGRQAPLFDQLAFVFAAVLAFDAIRNTAWVGLVALAVLPPLVDRLRGGAVVEPARLNRILGVTMLAAVVISVAGVAAKPTSWFTQGFPPAAAQATASSAGPNGRVFAMSDFADWVLWTRPELSGRIAFDARFELLSPKEVQRIARFQARAGNWLATVRGYSVFVVDRSQRALEQSLIRELPARVVFSSPQVVVLQRRG
jgi:hypothetical protein